MNVRCTDGTSFRCDRYELRKKGVKLYRGEAEEAPDRYDSDTDDHQIGFVPDELLLYILPEGVRPADVPTAQPPQQQPGQPIQQQPGQPSQQPTGQPIQQPPAGGTPPGTGQRR